MTHPGAFAALVAHHKPRGRLPRIAHPTLIANRYVKRIQGPVLEEAIALVREILVPELERFAARASRIATTDARESLGATMDEIEAKYAARWARKRFAKVVQPIAADLETFQAAQLNRQLRAAVSIDVVGAEPWTQDAIAEFVGENVTLIKSIPDRFFSDLEQNLARGLADGERWEGLATLIEKRYEVAQSRAELIARDQAGKFFGDLNRVRQSDLGITGAVWRTMNDDRVREDHVAREGQSFQWASGIEGETPGEPVLCRCYGEPDLAALQDSE